ncbi:hypothetical protein K449DRAFT_438928 [Hypoxylon sp. EC38]|nr:hypothetical protein K449DRAFT_438928 [Hypoxylon sp. EC38]
MPALTYFHGGGYTVGSVDEFENELRFMCEVAGMITIGVKYRLAPEWPSPTQLDEYEDEGKQPPLKAQDSFSINHV